jgi:GH43 family beta-xylosidase
MKHKSRWIVLAICSVMAAAGADERQEFHNPLLPSGADPWVTSRDGVYYYMATTGVNLTIWKTRDITDLEHAEKKVVWWPPETGPYSHQIWAPELHFLAGKWYIYFAADAGSNETHRIWVLENSADDPLTGEWTMKGKLADQSDRWAIDATVFENNGEMYAAWSGWPNDMDGEQDIYIARLANPWTVEGTRSRLSAPRYPWERHGDLPGRHVDVNEAPEFLIHDDDVFLVYSASGCWTNDYALGMLRASAKAELTKPSAWTKFVLPVFKGSPIAHAFGPGHNGFFKSPDGKQDWIIYHANLGPNDGCGAKRSPRAQLFGWNPDGTPDFGWPVPVEQALPKPSGTQPDKPESQTADPPPGASPAHR